MKRFLLCVSVTLLMAAAAVAQEHEGREAAGAAESHGKAEGHGSELWKWANFVLLAGGLGFLIYKNAGPFFRNRTDEIRQGIDQATKMKADADARYASMEQRLASLDKEIDSIRRHSCDEAAAEAARIRKETERELAKIQEQAQRDIESAAKTARQELRAYSAGLAVDLAKQRIRERMTAQDQDALVKSLVGDLKRKAFAETV